MAYLILNGIESHENSSPETEKYYEFDTGDKALVNRIYILLSLRKYGNRERIERSIASLCAESMKKKKTSAFSKISSDWLQGIKECIPLLRSKKQTLKRHDTNISNAYYCQICGVQRV